MPMFNWVQVITKNDAKFLCKKGKPNRHAKKAYQIIEDSLIDTFGVSDAYKKTLKNNIRIAVLRCDVMITGDRTKLIFIERLEQQNKEIEDSQVKGDIYEAIHNLQSRTPYRIDLKLITIFEFYTMIKYAK